MTLVQVAIDIYTFVNHPLVMFEMVVLDYLPSALFSFGPASSIPALDPPFGFVN